MFNPQFFLSLCLFLSVSSSEQITNTLGFFFEDLPNLINATAIKNQIQEVLPSNDTDTLFVILRMLDASTKFPSGLAIGAFVDLGNFDECYNIEYQDIFGKYCLGELPFSAFSQLSATFNPNANKLKLLPNPDVGIDMDYNNLDAMHYAVCVPSNLSAENIVGLMKYSEKFCYSKATEPEFTSGAIVMIFVYSLFATIIFGSTVYDLMLYYNEKKPVHEILIAFSFFTNGRKIITSSKNPDQLLCLNGIKAISMMWVILGHEYSCMSLAPISNLSEVMDWMKNSSNMFINGATVSVDTFFVVGGLVTVYTFMKSIDRGIKFNIFKFYLHRYLRLTPVYIMICLFVMYLATYVGNGPTWVLVDSIGAKPCFHSWWSSFLFITNYVQNGVCLPQTWYLSVDMQLFLLSPIVLLTLKKSPKWGLILLGILSVAGCLIPFLISYTENMFSTTSNEYSNLYYNKTHARFGPYVIGMAMGYFIYKYKKGNLKIILKPWMVVLAWLVILTGLVANLYASYPLTVSTIQDIWGFSLFVAFNRPTWAVCICGVIFLCVTGYGSPINWFLSLSIFQFLTKLSYSMYLIHTLILLIRYSAMRTTFQFSNLQLMHEFWGNFMLTLSVAFVLSLAFESPIIIIEKYIFGGGKAKPQTARAKE